jgi:hypothetical protein
MDEYCKKKNIGGLSNSTGIPKIFLKVKIVYEKKINYYMKKIERRRVVIKLKILENK